MAETFTQIHALGKWDDLDTPGAAALNGNWDKIDAAMVFYGTAFPAIYPLNKIFLRTDLQLLYFNTGTPTVPIWTPLSASGVIKADGTVPMAAALDFGGFKGVDAADPVSAQDLATKHYVDNVGFDALDKAFFIANGLMPGTTILEAKGAFPTPDDETGGITHLIKYSSYRLTGGGGYISFALGAHYTKLLAIFGLIHGFSNNGGVFACQNLSGGSPADGVLHMDEANSARFNLYQIPGFTPFGTDSLLTTAANNIMVGIGMAAYFDFTAHRIVTFMRWGMERWTFSQDVTDGTHMAIAYAQFAGAYLHDGGKLGTPIGIYGDL